MKPYSWRNNIQENYIPTCLCTLSSLGAKPSTHELKNV